MRVMIDSNILDRLDEDDEARDELINRRDILLLITAAQEREVAAIPEAAKSSRLLDIITQLCRRVAIAVPPTLSSSAESFSFTAPLSQAFDSLASYKGEVDDRIIAAAAIAGCDLLVSEDLEVLDKALAAGLTVMDWKLFLDRVVWAPRRRPKKS